MMDCLIDANKTNKTMQIKQLNYIGVYVII